MKKLKLNTETLRNLTPVEASRGAVDGNRSRLSAINISACVCTDGCEQTH